MNAIPMTDPWVDNIYRVEFNADPTKFFEKIKRLLTEDKRREKRVIQLLQQYEDAEISLGRIAEKLDLSRDEVLDLFEKYNIDLVDYDWAEEEKNIDIFLSQN